MCYHCYDRVIFHIGCEALHCCTTIISLLKAALKARLRGFPMENFLKLIFKYMQFQGNFYLLDRTKINIVAKQVYFIFFIKNIGVQLVFLVKQRSLKFVKSCMQCSTHSVYNQPI